MSFDSKKPIVLDDDSWRGERGRQTWGLDASGFEHAERFPPTDTDRNKGGHDPDIKRRVFDRDDAFDNDYLRQRDHWG